MAVHRLLLAVSISLLVIVVINSVLENASVRIATTTPAVDPTVEEQPEETTSLLGVFLAPLYVVVGIVLVYWFVRAVASFFGESKEEKLEKEEAVKRVMEDLVPWAGVEQHPNKNVSNEMEGMAPSGSDGDWDLLGVYHFEHTERGALAKKTKRIMDEMVEAGTNRKFIFALHLKIPKGSGKKHTSVVAFFRPREAKWDKGKLWKLFSRKNGELDTDADRKLPAPQLHFDFGEGGVAKNLIDNMFKGVPKFLTLPSIPGSKVKTKKGKLKHGGSYFEYMVDTGGRAADFFSRIKLLSRFKGIPIPVLGFSLRLNGMDQPDQNPMTLGRVSMEEHYKAGNAQPFPETK